MASQVELQIMQSVRYAAVIANFFRSGIAYQRISRSALQLLLRRNQNRNRAPDRDRFGVVGEMFDHDHDHDHDYDRED
jgi:hypothetical protein